MSLIHDIVSDFGQSLGFSNLRFNEQGVIQLQMADWGDFYLELIDQGILLYLAQRIDFPKLKHFRQALELCHPREEHPYSVNPGLFEEDKFVYAIRLSEEECTLPSLNQSLDLLKNMHSRTQV